MSTRHVQLRPQTADMLAKPIKGHGGFQSLMRRIQQGLRGYQLTIDEADLNNLLQSTRGRSVGGFQRRCRDIVVDAVIERLREEGFAIREDEPARVLPFDRSQPRLPFGGDL